MDVNSEDEYFLHTLPCEDHQHHLYCDQAGDLYPGPDMDTFIQDNLALLRRMYGESSALVSVGGKTFKESVRWGFFNNNEEELGNVI